MKSDKPEKRKIWWLASYPKSGNTWVRAFLCAYFDGKVDINSMGYVTGDAAPYLYHCCSPDRIEDLSMYEEACLRGSVCMHAIRCNPWNRVIIKTHHANMAVDDMPMIPRSLTQGAIYVVRDPRDVVVSAAAHFGDTIDDTIEKMEDETRAIHDDGKPLHLLCSWKTHVLSWLRETGFPTAVVKYEDLLDNPAEKFYKLLEYLGVDPDHDKVAEAVDLSSFKALREQEDKHGFYEKKQGDRFFRQGRSAWQEVLTQEQAERVWTYHRDAMERLGYGPSADTQGQGRDDSCGEPATESDRAA